jgi:hypothetical protein
VRRKYDRGEQYLLSVAYPDPTNDNRQSAGEPFPSNKKPTSKLQEAGFEAISSKLIIT